MLPIVTAVNLAAQQQPGTVLWTYDTGAVVSSSPALAADGTIYLAAAGLRAITNNGSSASNKWTLPVAGAPAIGSDDTIYCAYGGTLTAVNPNGIQKWTFSDGTSGSGVPAVAFDDTVYSFARREFHAISPLGAEKWGYDIAPPGSPVLSAVIGTDGNIYVGVGDELFAFTPTGSNSWSFRLYSVGSDSLAIGSGGIVYASTERLFAFAPDGTNIWSINHLFSGSPTIGKDGTIYVADTARALYAVSPDGQVTWHTLSNAPMFGTATAPAVDAGGRIYYCVSNSVWALNPQGQVQWSISAPNVPNPSVDVASTSPIIGPDGTLYAALGSTLYAIATGTNGPANSPWPMYRQNARHTGKIEKPALQQPRKRADANFEFQLYAQLGQTNTVEATTNLNTWTSLTSIVVTTVPQPVVDLTASNHPARFYRSSAP